MRFQAIQLATTRKEEETGFWIESEGTHRVRLSYRSEPSGLAMSPLRMFLRLS